MNWLKRFTERQTLAFLLIPALVILLSLPALWEDTDASWSSPYRFLNSLKGASLWWWILNCIGIMLVAFLCNRLVSTFNIFSRPNMGPGLFFVPIAAIWVSSTVFMPAIWASLALILSLTSLLDVYKQNKVLRQCFNTGFFLGLGALFVPELIILTPIFMLGILRVRAFQWREWVFLFLGTSLPLAYGFAATYVIGIEPIGYITRFNFTESFQPSWHLLIAGLLATLGLLFLPATFGKMAQGGRRMGALLSFLLIAQIGAVIVALFWSQENNYSTWVLIAPWIGTSFALWLHDGKQGFYRTLILIAYLAVCTFGLLLKYNILNL